MRAAAALLIGEHDFRHFCKARSAPWSPGTDAPACSRGPAVVLGRSACHLPSSPPPSVSWSFASPQAPQPGIGCVRDSLHGQCMQVSLLLTVQLSIGIRFAMQQVNGVRCNGGLSVHATLCAPWKQGPSAGRLCAGRCQQGEQLPAAHPRGERAGAARRRGPGRRARAAGAAPARDGLPVAPGARRGPPAGGGELARMP